MHNMPPVEFDGPSNPPAKNATPQHPDGRERSGEAAKGVVSTYCIRVIQFFGTNLLLTMMASAIFLSWVWPALGAVYVNPDITASWIAIIVIFFMSGLKLHTEEIKKSFVRLRFNFFVQLYAFVLVPGFVYIISRLLVSAELLQKSLADGLVICACLPQAICTVIVLSKSAGGDEATSILNPAFSNLVGIILSPFMIFFFLGVSSHVEEGKIALKLSTKVALPLLLGQVMHHFIPGATGFTTKHSNRLKRVQECAMTFIIFTTFSKLFLDGTGTSTLDVLLMGAAQLLIMLILMLWCWLLLRLFFPDQPKLHATGLFICISKTMPMGIPLINALYEDDPNLALYTLPLLIWYPITIVIGVLVAPYVLEYVERHEKRLNADSVTETDYYEMQGEIV